jgi:hypothetical protein
MIPNDKLFQLGGANMSDADNSVEVFTKPIMHAAKMNDFIWGSVMWRNEVN